MAATNDSKVFPKISVLWIFFLLIEFPSITNSSNLKFLASLPRFFLLTIFDLRELSSPSLKSLFLFISQIDAHRLIIESPKNS